MSVREHPDTVEIYRTSHEVHRGLHGTFDKLNMPGARLRCGLLNEVRLGFRCLRRVDGAHRFGSARNFKNRRLRRYEYVDQSSREGGAALCFGVS